jgi:hypothetical protein
MSWWISSGEEVVTRESSESIACWLVAARIADLRLEAQKAR